MSGNAGDSDWQQLLQRPVESYVLHRKPMLLIDQLVDAGPAHLVCSWTPEASGFFTLDGLGVPSYVGIEHMAQGIAIHAGMRARLQGQPPPLGMLLGTRCFQTSVTYFESDKRYYSHCRELMRSSEGIGSFACSIQDAQKVIASASLVVYERPQ